MGKLILYVRSTLES